MLIEIKSPLSIRRTKSATPPSQVVKLSDGTWFYPILNGAFSSYNLTGTKKIDTTTVEGQRNAYQKCAMVSGAINKIQEAGRNGRWVIEDKNSNPSTKDTPLARLMKRPNPLQTWADFIAQAIAFKKLFGYCLVLPSYAAGMEGSARGVFSLWVCPNWMINEIRYSGKIFGQSELSGIINFFRIGTTDVASDRVIICPDSEVNCDSTGMAFVLPQSRIYPMSDQVSNIVQAYEARYTLMAKKGALGILSNEAKDVAGAIPITTKEKEQIQTDFTQAYGLGADQSQIIITSANLKWQSMTFPTKDLMLFEEIKDDALMIYDKLGVPVFLTPYAEQTTYTNLPAAEKRFYTDTVIPGINGLLESICNFFKSEDDGQFLKVYFDHLECFQKSKKEEADALRAMTDALNQPLQSRVITVEEYRAIMSNFMPSGSPFDAEKVNGKTYVEKKTNETPAQ